MSRQLQRFTQSPKGHYLAYCQPLAQEQTLQLKVTTTSEPDLFLNWEQVGSLWQNDEDFRNLTTLALAQSPFPAFFWETPQITQSRKLQPWECVLVNAPALDNIVANPAPFSQQLGSQVPGTEICLFPNLGGDALLVVPCLVGPPTIYPHIATFVRNAPPSQAHSLWEQLGHSISQHLEQANDSPLWVSTSGLGVSWLHIRLDSFPKYYTHRPYRSDP